MNFLRNKLYQKSPYFFIDKPYHTPKHIKNDLTLLRHAQSFYNVASEKYIK